MTPRPIILLSRSWNLTFLARVKGVYHDPAGYFVDEAEAEAFDKQFPPKVKQKLPGQLW